MYIQKKENVMWKETLRIGVDIIDEQHKELFEKAEELLGEVNSTAIERKQKCISLILYLKDYAVKHFADEEAYQESIGYKGFAIHKKIHEEFKKDVLYHERKMIGSDFSDKDVKEFTGLLIAWLLYHVSDADQKIVKKSEELDLLHSYSDIISYSICNILDIYQVTDSQSVKKADVYDEINDDIFVIRAGLGGDISGYITLIYPPEFVKSLIFSMTGYESESIDDLGKSLLLAVSDFTCQAICRLISKEKDIDCHADLSAITNKYAIQSDERIALDTGKGIVEVGITIA